MMPTIGRPTTMGPGSSLGRLNATKTNRPFPVVGLEAGWEAEGGVLRTGISGEPHRSQHTAGSLNSLDILRSNYLGL